MNGQWVIKRPERIYARVYFVCFKTHSDRVGKTRTNCQYFFFEVQCAF